MRKSLCALALAASFAAPSLSYAEPITIDQAQLMKDIVAGTSTESVLKDWGQPDRVEYTSKAPVWVYSYAEERFGPDVTGEIKLEITEKSTVAKVFDDQGGLGVWALTGLIFLGIVFI